MNKLCGLTLSIVVLGCTSEGTAQRELAAPMPASSPEMAALEHLSSAAGPDRFARVHDTLYRGGQPSRADLAALRAIGVTTIVNLRAEALGQRRSEWSDARELGLTYHEYPFFGVFGAQTEFLDEVIRTLATREGEIIYVHDKDGRDRTSLVVALYRVCVDGWNPEEAWNREVLDFDHRPTIFSREIELTFRDHTSQHERIAATQTQAPIAHARLSEQLAKAGGHLDGDIAAVDQPTNTDGTVARTASGSRGATRTIAAPAPPDPITP